jgi:thiaminase
LETFISNQPDTETALAFSNLLHSTSKFQALPGTDTSLFLALVGASSALRLTALSHLETKLKANPTAELVELYRSSVHQFLLEDNEELVDAIVSSPKLLIGHLVHSL